MPILQVSLSSTVGCWIEQKGMAMQEALALTTAEDVISRVASSVLRAYEDLKYTAQPASNSSGKTSINLLHQQHESISMSSLPGARLHTPCVSKGPRNVGFAKEIKHTKHAKYIDSK